MKTLGRCKGVTREGHRCTKESRFKGFCIAHMPQIHVKKYIRYKRR